MFGLPSCRRLVVCTHIVRHRNIIAGASLLITSANENYVVVVTLFVRLSVWNFAQNLTNGFAGNFQGRLAMGQRTND